MSDLAIEIRNLGKKYTIKHQQTALREIFTDNLGRLRKTILSRLRESHAATVKEEFWALRNIDADIAEGDRIGVIGENGSGKSTLLKILSRITDPTEGSARIRGRVASLLEVGTGFHPELSGRENIYLNGAILGMRHSDIARKFKEAHIELSLFIDPSLPMVQASHALKAQWIELHTGSYANTYAMLYSNLSKTQHAISSLALDRKSLHVKLENCLQELCLASKEAHLLGLRVAAGHGLNYQNVRAIAAIEEIVELNIGQSIIARSIFTGLENAIKEMIGLLR